MNFIHSVQKWGAYCNWFKASASPWKSGSHHEISWLCRKFSQAASPSLGGKACYFSSNKAQLFASPMQTHLPNPVEERAWRQKSLLLHNYWCPALGRFHIDRPLGRKLLSPNCSRPMGTVSERDIEQPWCPKHFMSSECMCGGRQKVPICQSRKYKNMSLGDGLGNPESPFEMGLNQSCHPVKFIEKSYLGFFGNLKHFKSSGAVAKRFLSLLQN